MRHNRRVDDLLSYDDALLEGRAFFTDMDFEVGNGASFSIGIETNDVPLIIFTWTVLSSINNFTFEFFRGGTFSGGTDVSVVRQNNSVAWDDPLFNQLKQEVTIDTPGTLLYDINSAAETLRAGESGTFKSITAKNAVSYMTITNTGGASAPVDLIIVFGVYPTVALDLLDD